jgi:hypothetical protein
VDKLLRCNRPSFLPLSNSGSNGTGNEEREMVVLIRFLLAAKKEWKRIMTPSSKDTEIGAWGMIIFGSVNDTDW